MNNQVKLIDQTKLLKAVSEEKSRHERARDRLEIDHKYWEFHEGAVSTLEWLEKKIEKGMFDPDTPPVPTIKPGDKVRHVSIGTHGLAVETSDVGVFVHWSTGQRSWYPYASLEVVE